MAKDGGRGRSYDPPVQDFRKKTGRFNAKVGKTERTETVNRAVARKQDFPVRQVLLSMAIFGAVSAILYAYLSYVLADDDLDDEPASGR